MKNRSKQQPMTLDRLAQMVAKGFESSATKEDLAPLATKEELRAIGSRLAKVEYQVDETHDILRRFEEHDILNLQKRVKVLEKAVRALATQSPAK